MVLDTGEHVRTR